MDTLLLQELWSTEGISAVLSGFPVLPTFMLVTMLRMALSAVIGERAINNVAYSTKTPKRQFDSKGRRYAESFSYQSAPSWMRKHCSEPGSFEVDISNCYPSILANVCRDKCPCPSLQFYLGNRDQVLVDIQRAVKIDRSEAKQLILAIVFGSAWRYYLAKKLSIRPERVYPCEFLDCLQAEMATIRTVVASLDESKQIKGELEATGMPRHKIPSMCFSVFLERKERLVIDSMLLFFAVDLDIKAATLLHDGFIVNGDATLRDGLIVHRNRNRPCVPVKSVCEGMARAIARDTGMRIIVQITLLADDKRLDPLTIQQEKRRPDIFRSITLMDDEYVKIPVFGFRERCIAIKAGMRGGKTTAMVNFLRTTVSSHDRVLLTTGRIQQALSLVGGLSHVDELGHRISDVISCDGQPFKIFLYKDKEENLYSDAPGIYICQWESLHCLISPGTNSYKSFDYIINDEIRSTLNQSCVAVTNREYLRTNMHLFRDVCSKTKCLLFDADLLVDGMVARFCLARFGGIWDDSEIRVEEYTRQPMPRKLVVTTDKQYFSDSIKNDVLKARSGRLNGEGSHPVFIACRSKRGMNDLVCLLTGTSNHEFMKDGVAFFSSASTTKQMSVWENIDKFIAENEVDVILTTSKVTVCADMKTPVTSCFIMANSMGGCHARDLFQTIGRARHPMTEDIIVLISSPQQGGKEPAFKDISASMLEDALIRKKYIRVLEIDVGFDVEDENRFNRLVVERSPDWMINLACDTEMEIQNNRGSMFHATLLRNANYKKWTVEIRGIPLDPGSDEDLKDAHSITGEEIKEHEKALLEDMKSMPIEELEDIAKAKTDDGQQKEKVFIAAFLVRFKTFIPHMQIEQMKYYMKNYGVFERVAALSMQEERLCAIDLSRMLRSANKGIMERAPLLHNAITLLHGLIIGVMGLNFDESFTDAPNEETNHRNRDIDDFDISKGELAEKFTDIQDCCMEINRNLGTARSQKKTPYKDRGLGAVRIIDHVLKLFGRKLESCKPKEQRSRDSGRVYRIVKDENFALLFAHYIPKEYPDHMKNGMKSMIRHAKRDNPHMLKKRAAPVVMGERGREHPGDGDEGQVSDSRAIHNKRLKQQAIIDNRHDQAVDATLLGLLEGL